jgi:hypothetical protein
VCTGDSFSGGKAAGVRSWQLQFNAEIKKTWIYTSTLSHVFMARCLVKHRYNFPSSFTNVWEIIMNSAVTGYGLNSIRTKERDFRFVIASRTTVGHKASYPMGTGGSLPECNWTWLCCRPIPRTKWDKFHFHLPCTSPECGSWQRGKLHHLLQFMLNGVSISRPPPPLKSHFRYWRKQAIILFCFGLTTKCWRSIRTWDRQIKTMNWQVM